ncbi:hypothetical protein Scep_029778 [Stephania cephalantha]|uniref:Uncharacterized protein n=1 Tax=Stephania cephalantha TaxID=152367 RepID=A0AAP0HFY6_9MAGN
MVALGTFRWLSMRDAHSAALPYNEQNIITADIDESSGLSKDWENEELNNEGKEASTGVENVENYEGGNDDKIESQVAIEEGLHALATDETPLSEIWDFAEECLNGMEKENSISESAPLDMKLTWRDGIVLFDFYPVDNP